MTEHDDLRGDIPALLASRLDEPSRLRLEKHLEDCASCTETVSVARGILAALEEGGEAVWEKHPSVERVLGLATESEPVEGGRFAAHVAVCPTCTLEIDAWKAVRVKGLGRAPDSLDREEDARRPGTAPASIRSRVPPVLLGIAAGVFLGAALTALLIGRGGTGAPPGAGSGPGLTTPAPWSGAPRWAQLELPSRGDGRLSVVRISSEDPFVLLLAPAEFKRSGGSGAIYAFEILDAAGHTAWRTELSSEQLEARIDPASSFMPLLVPTGQLRAGSYELAVRESRDGPDPLLRIPFEVRLASSTDAHGE